MKEDVVFETLLCHSLWVLEYVRRAKGEKSCFLANVVECVSEAHHAASASAAGHFSLVIV